jgi:TetR/AcrR family transcriptional regulator, transcriptional repressor for nem operon
MSKDTKTRAIAEAKKLVQTFGYNGFSFQHVADALGIKKPSLYDHFGSKEELGRDLVADYAQNFMQWTETIEVFGPRDKVGALFELFFKIASNEGRICPLSALTADLNTLPKSVRKALGKICHFQRDWLKSVVEDGQKQKVFRADLSSLHLADLILSLGLGSQLIARLESDPKGIRNRKEQLFKLLEPNHRASSR